MRELLIASMAMGGLVSPVGLRAAIAQESMSIEQVTVLAQKRAASLQDVPISLSTLTSNDLADAGIDTVEGVAEALPGLDLQRSVSPVTTTLRIRRVGNLGNIPTFEPAVGLFVDGAFRSRSLLSTGDLLDIDHVEVLSGPQSALYGKNVTAGVVAIYTRKPGDRFSAEVELTGGAIDAPRSAGLARLKAAVNGPMTSTLRGGIAAAYSAHDATMQNALPDSPDGNDLSRTTLRGQLLWSPSAHLDVRLIAGHLDEQDAQGESDVFLAPEAGSTAVATALQQTGSVASCADNLPGNRRSCSPTTNQLDLEATDITLLTDYRLPNDWELSSITGWDRYEDFRDENDAVQLYAPLLFFHDSERATSIQQELRLASAATSRIAWMAGLSYYANEYERGTGGDRPMFGPNGALAFSPLWPAILRMPLALPGQLGLHDSHLDTEYYSIFGQVAFTLGEHFKLTATARWQTEEKNGSIRNSVTQPGASVISTVFTPTTSPTGAPVNGSLQRTTDYFTWSLTPQYRFNDDLMSYLTVSRGGKSGGFNTGFGNAPLTAREFHDETIDHLEIGLRAALANGRIRLSSAVFSTVFHDYQDAAFISAQFTVGNADRVELKGVELEGRVVFDAKTTADLAISFADLVYATNTTGMCSPGRSPDGSLPRSCDMSGEHPIDAPQWVINAGLQHVRPVRWGELSLRLQGSWTDRYNTSFSADPRLVQQPYFDVDLRFGVAVGSRYECVLWGDNLLNENVAYINSVLNLFDDASYQSYFAEPRSYGLTVRMRF